MKRTCVGLSVLLVLIGCVLPMSAQQAASETAPAMMRFTGVLAGFDSKPLRGTVGVNFFLYAEKEGGAPLWMETQNVRPDRNGHYSVMLGSASAQGLPAEVFAGDGERWLGVQASGQAEQARTILFSLPYGGIPASASPQAIQPALVAPGPGSDGVQKLPPTVHGNGVVNFIPVWTDTKIIGESVLSQSGSNVGVGTTAPATNLDVFSSAPGIHAPIAQFGSTGATDSNSILTYNGSGKTEMFQSGCANCFIPLAQAGDGGMRVNPGKSLFLGDSGNPRLRLDSAGNAEQPRTANGMVKATILYDGLHDKIVRCFNSSLSGSAATTPPCGFISDKTGKGDYILDFGFEVDDRFLSLTQLGPENAAMNDISVCFGSCINHPTSHQTEVTIGWADFDLSYHFQDGTFFLFVY